MWLKLRGTDSQGLQARTWLLCRKQSCPVAGLMVHLVDSIPLVICDREEARASDMILRPFSIFGFRTRADTGDSIYLLHRDLQTVHTPMQHGPHLGAGEALGGAGSVTSSFPRRGRVCTVPRARRVAEWAFGSVLAWSSRFFPLDIVQ